MRPWQTGPCRWAHWLCQATNSPSILNTPTSVPSHEITLRLPSANSSRRPTTYDFIAGRSSPGLFLVGPESNGATPALTGHFGAAGPPELQVDRPPAAA